jgi:hypothetical protein
MRVLLLLFLAFSLCASATASQRMPHDCCPDQPCSIQCIAMGCMPGNVALAPAPDISVPFVTALAGVAFREPGDAVPDTFEEIWIPPD